MNSPLKPNKINNSNNNKSQVKLRSALKDSS